MSNEAAYLATLKVPYQLGRDGCIRTIRRLDTPPPKSLIPEAVLRLKRRWDAGCALPARQRSDIKKRLRRYWLLPEPQPRLKQCRKAYQKAWRARNPGYGAALKALEEPVQGSVE